MLRKLLKTYAELISAVIVGVGVYRFAIPWLVSQKDYFLIALGVVMAVSVFPLLAYLVYKLGRELNQLATEYIKHDNK